MKKILVFLLAAVTAVPMSACSGETAQVPTDSTDTESAEMVSVDYSLADTDEEYAYKIMDRFYESPEEYENKTVSVKGTVSVIKSGDNTYYYLAVDDGGDNMVTIPFSVKQLEDKDIPQNNDKCELAGTLKEISDSGVYGIYVDKNGIKNLTASYRSELSYAEGDVTLENSQVLSAYGVKVRFKGVEQEMFNLIISNDSEQTIVVRTFDSKLNGESAEYSLYESLKPGEEREVSVCLPLQEKAAESLSMRFELDDDSYNTMYTTEEIVFKP